MANDVDIESPDDRTDPRLALLLSSVFGAGADATLELTVVVDGAVVSGSVVSRRAWMQRQNDQVRIGSWAVAGVLDTWESGPRNTGPQVTGTFRPVRTGTSISWGPCSCQEVSGFRLRRPGLMPGRSLRGASAGSPKTSGA